MKKVIAFLMSIIITGGAVPAAQFLDPTTKFEANAAEIEVPETNWNRFNPDDYEGFNGAEINNEYFAVNYADGHAEIIKVNPALAGEFDIPSIVNGTPVTKINASAFTSATTAGGSIACLGISAVTIPDTVKEIGTAAFMNCANIKEVEFGNSVETIEKCAFDNCQSLETVDLPNSVTTLGVEAFGNCKNLTSINLSNNLTSIESNTFQKCTKLEEIVIPDNVTTIKMDAFNTCQNLTKVTLSKSLTEIGERAFQWCGKLTEINIPANVTTIENNAFGNCGNLKSITINNPDYEINPDMGNIAYNPDVTIYCDPNSKAYEFAADNEVKADTVENATTTTTKATTTTTTTTTTTKATTTTTAKPKTTTTTYKPTAEGFVIRMYNIALNRNPDAKGLKSWTTQLNNRQKTAADIISAFFNSNEYKNSKKTSEQMVIDCYKAMLNRAPDAKGKADWAKKLDTGMTINAVCKGIVGSQEFKNVCKTYGITPGTITIKNARDENYDRTAFVYRLYTNCLGRTPDAAGLENWCKNLKNGTTGAQAVKGFFTSKEFTSRKRTNRAFVETVYRTMLGRAGDAKGINSWTTQLSKGKTRINVINGFLGSGEFKNACAKAGIKVGNKI